MSSHCNSHSHYRIDDVVSDVLWSQRLDVLVDVRSFAVVLQTDVGELCIADETWRDVRDAQRSADEVMTRSLSEAIDCEL